MYVSFREGVPMRQGSESRELWELGQNKISQNIWLSIGDLFEQSQGSCEAILWVH
jgi:hypothetical protein